MPCISQYIGEVLTFRGGTEELIGVNQVKGGIVFEKYYTQRENEFQTPLGEKTPWEGGDYSLWLQRNKQRCFMKGLINLLRSRNFIWRCNEESLEHLSWEMTWSVLFYKHQLGFMMESLFIPRIHIEGLPCARTLPGAEIKLLLVNFLISGNSHSNAYLCVWCSSRGGEK